MHKLNSLVHPPPSYRVLATGLVLPEGSCVGPDGELYVVDAGTGTICRISDSGEVSEFVSTGGRPNGLAFGPGGDLFVADSGRRAILRVTPSGELSVFASEYDGHEFTGPNDLAFGPSGNLFFTDPGRKPPPDPSISPVYRATPDGVVSPFAVDLAYPNGVAFSPDGKELYVSEMRANRLLAFEITEFEQLAQYRMVRRFREPAHPDGLAIDTKGRILGALRGIGALSIVSAAGKLEELYYVQGWRPSNLAFGGPDRRTVYVTDVANASIVAFEHDVPGAALF